MIEIPVGMFIFMSLLSGWAIADIVGDSRRAWRASRGDN